VGEERLSRAADGGKELRDAGAERETEGSLSIGDFSGQATGRLPGSIDQGVEQGFDKIAQAECHVGFPN
jgi:hypothetical protein